MQLRGETAAASCPHNPKAKTKKCVVGWLVGGTCMHACKIIDLSVLFIALFTDFGVLFAVGR